MITSRWKDLLAVVFGQMSNLRQLVKYPVITHSFFCLWNKVLKRLRNVSSTTVEEGNVSDCIQSLLDATDVLLNGIESSLVPKLCHNKCLGILLQGVPYCDLVVRQDLRAACYMTAARRNLSMMLENVTDSSSRRKCVKKWVFEVLNLEVPTEDWAGRRSTPELRQFFEGVAETCGHDSVNVGVNASADCAERDSKVSDEQIEQPLVRLKRSFRVTPCAVENRFLCGNNSQQQIEKTLRKIVLLALRSMAVVASSVSTEGKKK
jgi:hypothetical protein